MPNIALDTVTESNITTLRLSGSCDVRMATELQNAIIAIQSNGASLVIDVTAIDSLDASCLQLLTAAKRESELHVTIQSKADSEATKWIALSGLTEMLGTGG